MDAGVEEGEEIGELVCCGHEAEGLVEPTVMAEGLVEVLCGVGDNAEDLVAGDCEESEEEGELAGIDMCGVVCDCGEDDGVWIDVEVGPRGCAVFERNLGWIDDGGEELVGAAGVAVIEPPVVVLWFEDSDGIETVVGFADR